MRKIKLTQNQYALVDDKDYLSLIKFKWYAAKNNSNKTYYAVRNSKKTEGYSKRMRIAMHNQIMGQKLIDHKNMNTLDNRRCNLRPASHRLNICNRKKLATNKSGYKGVSWSKSNKGFVAQIRNNGTKIYLGTFSDPKKAHEAYKKAAVKYFGEYARW